APLFPYTTPFRSDVGVEVVERRLRVGAGAVGVGRALVGPRRVTHAHVPITRSRRRGIRIRSRRSFAYVGPTKDGRWPRPRPRRTTPTGWTCPPRCSRC